MRPRFNILWLVIVVLFISSVLIFSQYTSPVARPLAVAPPAAQNPPRDNSRALVVKDLQAVKDEVAIKIKEPASRRKVKEKRGELNPSSSATPAAASTVPSKTAAPPSKTAAPPPKTAASTAASAAPTTSAARQVPASAVFCVNPSRSAADLLGPNLNTPHRFTYGPSLAAEAKAMAENPAKHGVRFGIAYRALPPFKMLVHPAGADIYVSNSILWWGTWDKDIYQTMHAVLADTPGPVHVLDIGGNIGFFTLSALSLGHRVTTIEPLLQNLRLLTHSVALNGWQDRSTVYHNAVSFEHTTFAMNVDAENKGGTSMVNRGTAAAGAQQVYGVDFIESIRVDDLFDSLGPIYLLKIDIEGFELPALQGATRLLCDKANQPKVILAELSQASRARDNCKFQAFVTFLKGCGYTSASQTKLRSEIDLATSTETDVAIFLAPMKLTPSLQHKYAEIETRGAKETRPPGQGEG